MTHSDGGQSHLPGSVLNCYTYATFSSSINKPKGQMVQIMKLKYRKRLFIKTFYVSVGVCACVPSSERGGVLMSIWVHMWCMYVVCVLCTSVWLCVIYAHVYMICRHASVMNAYERVYDVCTWVCGYTCVRVSRPVVRIRSVPWLVSPLLLRRSLSVCRLLVSYTGWLMRPRELSVFMASALREHFFFKTLVLRIRTQEPTPAGTFLF